MKLQYLTNCVNSTAEHINNMVEVAREITYGTFIKHVDWKELANMFSCETHYKHGLLLKNDWAVSYFKSKYRGKPCYYVCHSCIEYIFI